MYTIFFLVVILVTFVRSFTSQSQIVDFYSNSVYFLLDGRENCNKFVDILGLRTIFPLFMTTPKKSKKRVISVESHEEHVLSIISSMLRNCKGPQRQRLLSKFTENEFEKVERLLELHLKYLEKVDAVDAEIDEDNEAEDEVYLKRLSGGLFTLQLIDYIILEISATSDTIKQHVVKILNLRKASMKRIRHIMRGKYFLYSYTSYTRMNCNVFSSISEYAGNLGETEDNEWRDQEQQHIIQLVDRF